MDVGHERGAGPPAHFHDGLRGCPAEEQGHGAARSKRVGANGDAAHLRKCSGHIRVRSGYVHVFFPDSIVWFHVVMIVSRN